MEPLTTCVSISTALYEAGLYFSAYVLLDIGKHSVLGNTPAESSFAYFHSLGMVHAALRNHLAAQSAFEKALDIVLYHSFIHFPKDFSTKADGAESKEFAKLRIELIERMSFVEQCSDLNTNHPKGFAVGSSEFPSDTASRMKIVEMLERVPDEHKPVSYWWRLGCVYEMENMKEKAIKCFFKIIEKNIPAIQVYQKLIKVCTNFMIETHLIFLCSWIQRGKAH